MAALEDMFDQLDQLCASRKGYLGKLCHDEKANTCIHTSTQSTHPMCTHARWCIHACMVHGMRDERGGEGRGGVEWSRWGARGGGIYALVRLIYSPACTSRRPSGHVE